MRIPVGDAGQRIATPKQMPVGQANTQVADAAARLGNVIQQGVTDKMFEQQREKQQLVDIEAITQLKTRQSAVDNLVNDIKSRNLTDSDEINKAFDEGFAKLSPAEVKGMNAVQAARYNQGNELLNIDAQNKLGGLISDGNNRAASNNINSMISIGAKQAIDGEDPKIAFSFLSDPTIDEAGRRAFPNWDVKKTEAVSGITFSGISSKASSDIDAAEKMLESYKDKLLPPDYMKARELVGTEREIKDADSIANVIALGSGVIDGKYFGESKPVTVNLAPKEGQEKIDLAAMLAVTGAIESRKLRERVEAKVRKDFADSERAEKQAYDDNLEAAWDIVARTESFTDIPANILSRIKPKDRTALMGGLPKQTDPNFNIELIDHPERLTEDYIKANRFRISNSDYINLLAKAKSPDRGEKVIDASIITTQLNDVLQQTGLSNLINPDKDKDKAEKIDLMARIQREVDARQSGGKKLTLSEQREVMLGLVRPITVKAIQTRAGVFKSETTMEIPAYKLKNIGNVVVPDEARSKILKDLSGRGVTNPPESVIQNLYLRLLGEE